jgi:hypothetical protein
MKRRDYWLAMMVGAVVDSIKAPLDKSRQVAGTLEKAAGKTADAVKDAAQ